MRAKTSMDRHGDRHGEYGVASAFCRVGCTRIHYIMHVYFRVPPLPPTTIERCGQIIFSWQ